MGKTATGAVWLDRFKTDPYDFWQFWRNTADEDVGKFLKIFTELPLEECERLGALEGQEIRDAKIALAREVCTMCHGKQAAERAEKNAKFNFEAGGLGGEMQKVSMSLDDANDAGLIVNGKLLHVTNPVSILMQVGFARTGKEAKRLIASGVIKINDELIPDAAHIHIDLDKDLKVSMGKKRHATVKFQHKSA